MLSSGLFWTRVAIYMNATDLGGLSSGWQYRGVWTTTVPPGSNLPPTAGTATPSSGSGSSQSFTFTYSDSNGFTDLHAEFVLFNTSVNTDNACYVLYSRPTNNLYLADDNSATLLGPVAPGGPGSLQNTQCILDVGSFVVSGSGNTLTLTMSLTFKTSFPGLKNIYLSAGDIGNLSSGWQARGTWTVPSGPNQPPTADSASPNTGSGSTQTFNFTYSDANGSLDLGAIYALFQSSLNGVNACYVFYQRPVNAFYLVNDTNTAVLGLVAPGSATTVQNSQCTLNGMGSSVSRLGLALTISVALTFKPAFAGTKTIFMNAYDGAGLNSGWQNRGAWSVPGPPNVAPTSDSVTPSSGSGLAQSFSFAFSDGNGFADLNFTHVLFNSSLNGVNACYVFYNRPVSALYLLNDANTAVLGPVTPGSAGSVLNNQCTLNGTGSSFSGAGNTLTLNVSLTFKPAFAGAKTVFMNAYDVAGLNSGWQSRGIWTVP